MEKLKAFLKRKDIVISGKRYGIDALGAMAQGLFCSLLIGTIVKTLGEQIGVQFLIDVGGYASAMSGPAMAVAIGWALKAPPMVLFSLATVGCAANALGSTTLSGEPGAGCAGQCGHRHGPHPAHLLRRHLRRLLPHGAGGGRGGGGVLRQHGGLRRAVLPG